MVNALFHYKSLKKMNFKDFDRWITTFYRAAYQDGKNEAEQEFEAQVEKFTPEELKAILTSVKGISGRLADEAIDRMLGTEET